jgi:TolA-binding protein
MIRTLGLLGLLLSTTDAVAAGGAPTLRQLDLVVTEAGNLGRTVDRLEADFTRRRGLIGEAEANRRFEDGVYRYLIGDFETAAVLFFGLVQSDALASAALARDSEWYLAECLLERKSYRSAEAAYQIILQRGSTHAFYSDAVLGLLEVYGLTRNPEAFDATYKEYVLSGKVQATDRVRYTVAKNLWRQGQNARAKAMFSELQPTDEYYARARYFLGAILSAEGDYAAALAEFQKVQALPDPGEIAHLNLLALGRISYELGQYAEAAGYYQAIPGESEFFADQLYELTWAYIKQERWSDAQSQIDVFMVGFPGHRHAVELRLLQGHMRMKQDDLFHALTRYEAVVAEYGPFSDQLRNIELDREQTEEWFRRISESKATEMDDRLPAFAIEMLIDDPSMERAVSAHRELGRQVDDLANGRTLANDVRGVLQQENPAIGTFERGRGELSRVRDNSLSLRATLLSIELAYIEDEGDSTASTAARGLAERLAVLQARAEELKGDATSQVDLRQAHLDQVREVQGLAARVAAEAESLARRNLALRRRLDDTAAGMAADDANLARDLIDDLGTEVAEIQRELTRLQSGATRNAVARTIPDSPRDAQIVDHRGMIARDYADLRTQDMRLRSQVADASAAEVFRKVDEVWSLVERNDARVDGIRSRLDEAERREVAIMRELLGEQERELLALDAGVGQTRASTEGLAVDITTDSVARVKADLADTVMQADMGIVDVYWLRKTATTDEMTRLAKERGTKTAAMDERYRLVRQKLDEQGGQKTP